MKFPRLLNDKQYAFKKFLIELENYIKDEKFEKIFRKLKWKLKNKEFKSSLNSSKTLFTCQLLDTSTIYDEHNKPINKKLVITNSRIKSICILTGLWIHKNSLGFLWSIPQLKVYSSPINSCLIIDDVIKITPETRDVECPCCGGVIEVDVKIPPQEPQIQYIQIPASEDADERIFGKFAKMRAVGVPLIAVKQKIQLEGLDFKTFESYMKRKKNTNTLLQKNKFNDLNSKTLITQKDNTHIKSKTNPILGFSMNDLLGQRKNLKKAKKRKKIADNDNGFLVSSAMKQSNLSLIHI